MPMEKLLHAYQKIPDAYGEVIFQASILRFVLDEITSELVFPIQSHHPPRGADG